MCFITRRYSHPLRKKHSTSWVLHPTFQCIYWSDGSIHSTFQCIHRSVGCINEIEFFWKQWNQKESNDNHFTIRRRNRSMLFSAKELVVFWSFYLGCEKFDKHLRNRLELLIVRFSEKADELELCKNKSIFLKIVNLSNQQQLCTLHTRVFIIKSQIIENIQNFSSIWKVTYIVSGF